MASLKTQPNKKSPKEFIQAVDNEKRRKDALEMLKTMEVITGEKPVMWGDSIIGYGNYHYKYESGREGDWFLVGFSPRKQNLVLYLMDGVQRYSELLEKLGKHKTSKACLYINKLEDVEMDILKKLIRESVQHMKNK